MPAHEDAVRIRHMLDAARRALAYSQGRNREDLDSDELLALALVRLLEVIGEGALKPVAGEPSGYCLVGDCRNPRPPHSRLL